MKMVSWKFKKCPRCAGDLYIDKDMDGWYEQCLQCSYRRDLRSLEGVPEQTAPTAEKPKK